MKKLFLILLLGSCSFTPSDPADLMTSQNNYSFDLETQGKQYPFWNISFTGFFVADQDPRSVSNPTEQQKYDSRLININDKRLMLKSLAFLRFVINTPEFTTNVLKQKYQSSRTVTDSRGSVKEGDPLDSKRILEILQKRSYSLQIQKRIMDSEAAAIGVLGPFIYLMDDNNPSVNNSSWIAFPNDQNWSTGGYLKQVYIAGVIFHEMLHNTGFTHKDKVSNDATYGTQYVFKIVASDPTWQRKYQKQLQTYINYYIDRYQKEWLLTDTIAVKKKKIRSKRDLAFKRVVQETVEICILNKDGTHTIKKISKDSVEYI